MKIKEFQKVNERPLVTIGPGDSVIMAMKKLVENNIGALPVCDPSGELLGIVTERDLLRECVQHNMDIADTAVELIMNKEVIIALPEDDIIYVMEAMTQKGIRHLPIMVGRKLTGMISARDLVEHQLEESRSKVRYLSDYLRLVSAVLKMDAENTE